MVRGVFTCTMRSFTPFFDVCLLTTLSLIPPSPGLPHLIKLVRRTGFALLWHKWQIQTIQTSCVWTPLQLCPITAIKTQASLSLSLLFIFAFISHLRRLKTLPYTPQRLQLYKTMFPYLVCMCAASSVLA